MRFFGIHYSHDASYTVLNEAGEIEFLGVVDRYVRKPHVQRHYGILRHLFPDLPLPKRGDTVVFTKDYDMFRADQCLSEIGITFRVKETVELTNYGCVNRLFRTQEEVDLICIDHHLAHACSAWCFRTDDAERLFIAYDGGGSNANKTGSASLVGVISGKQVRALEDPKTVAKGGIESTARLTEAFGIFGVGNLMGLAGALPDAPVCEQLSNSPLNSRQLSEQQMTECAGFYRYIIEGTWSSVREKIGNMGEGRGLVLSGGTALALELNTRIYDLSSGDIVFGPAPEDSGLSLGAAAFGRFHLTGHWPIPLQSPSLVALQRDLPILGDNDPKSVALKLANDEIIGLMRDNAELGPRGLGFRSLLASAHSAHMFSMVSIRIKNREPFRPLAPVVTSREFDNLFVGPKGHYMQYAVRARETATELIPATIHKDGTSRPQVVFPDRDPWLHTVLEEYGRMRGVECLINTSLNVSGKPICNTYEDALDDFTNCPVHLISLGGKQWIRQDSH